MTLLEQCRQAADRLGKQTTYAEIFEAIKSYRGKDRIGFALGLTSYLNDREVCLPIWDSRRYHKLNQEIVKRWKQRR